ncbi:hypothetical protein SGL43_04110 [Streptomyces globisporus]|uniref:Uncharacterized protein n=1 Tax=Streptomyces globisporus TaxID=1908 RepID=A0ABM9H0F5_STRGL|nr:hypothetical protein SGL43_04110 [Streptomyces globisporus]
MNAAVQKRRWLRVTDLRPTYTVSQRVVPRVHAPTDEERYSKEAGARPAVGRVDNSPV